ncbi:MAG TPA: Ni/Fe-hydrogenase, b-type cytochrome subunit [Clostridia bacterium]|nr:Ni/Fe-hydrogenase, b-type cytochrome subunit [Clostridia bacterium]
MSSQEQFHWPQRLAHLINLIAIVLLIFTGFYIYYPFAAGLMGAARYFHYIAAFVLILNMVWRVYYAFFGKYRDYYEYKPELGKILRVVKYYCFMGEAPAARGRYNALQKLAYLSIPFLVMYQACTGMALAMPDRLAGFIEALGGMANVRALHYFGTWLFICFVLIHLYMVFSEKPYQVMVMFLGKEPGQQKPLMKQAGSHVQQKQ